MRWALVIAASALVAACSAGNGTDIGRTPLSVPAKTTESARTTVARPTTTTPTTRPPVAAAPGTGADVAEIIDWIEAGRPAAPESFGTVTRDGVSTTVDGVAFSTDTVNCTATAAYRDGALACLVDLDDPPPRPPDAVSVWKGNWVEFDGPTVQIGAVRGDPGPFGDGAGATLPTGESITFGDVRCRADTAAVWCVDHAYRSAVRMGADGVDGFGCLTAAQAPPGIGIRLSC